MIARRHRIFAVAGPLIAVSWLSMALLDPDPRTDGVFHDIMLGYFFGSLFAHATLSAAWLAFGPGTLVWRLPLSIAWVASLPIAIAINVSFNGGPRDGPVLLGGCLFGQWLILQLPFWGLALGLSTGLRHAEDIERAFDPREWQFGIRQLIIITAIVGVVFGVGRLVITNLGERFTMLQGEGPILMFLAAAAIVLTLPLLLAALMRYWAIPGVVLVLGLMIVGTAWELPLLRSVYTGAGPGLVGLAAINFFTAAVILAIASPVRLSGYSLARRG